MVSRRSFVMLIIVPRRADEDVSAQRALETVAAGQKAENLLDFDADDDAVAPEASIAATAFSSGFAQPIKTAQVAAKNPLDELMDLFASTSVAPSQPAPASAPPPRTGQKRTESEDLLGLF